MSTAEIAFRETGSAPSQTDKLITCLMEANGEWVGLPQLVEAIGGYAAHSRACDARRKGYDIQNKVDFDEATGKRKSFYRVVA